MNDHHPNPREQLEAQVAALANTAKEVWPEVAVVLLSLKSAMLADEVDPLAAAAVHVSQDFIDRMSKVNNPLS